MFGFDQLPKAKVETTESMFMRGGFQVLSISKSGAEWTRSSGTLSEDRSAMVFDKETVTCVLKALLGLRPDILDDYNSGRIRFSPMDGGMYALARAG